MGQILDAMTLVSFFNNILKFAVGGTTVWLAALGAGIILMLGLGYLKVLRNRKAMQDSEEQKQKDQISNKTENQEISAGAEVAEQAVAEERAKNPDQHKKPRPPQ